MVNRSRGNRNVPPANDPVEDNPNPDPVEGALEGVADNLNPAIPPGLDLQGIMAIIASQQATFMEWRGMEIARDARRQADAATVQSQKTLLMQNVTDARQVGGMCGYEQKQPL